MKSKTAAIIVILLLIGVLGALIAFLVLGDTFAGEAAADIPTLPTAEASTGNIIDEITGAAEIKGASTEKLKAAKWRYYNAFVAPLNKKIAAGTPLVEYTNGESLRAPYDLIIRSKELPEKKYDALTDDHYLEVSRVDLMHVELSVHENDIAMLSEGQRAVVTLGSDENRVYEGTIVNINQVGAYNATGSKYTVTVEVINDGSLMIGMSADVSIVVSEVTDVLTVPVSAINDGKEGASVLVSKPDGSVETVPVETGLSDGTMVEIKSGLSAGDKVIVNEATPDMSGGGMAGAGMAYTFSM